MGVFRDFVKSVGSGIVSWADKPNKQRVDENMQFMDAIGSASQTKASSVPDHGRIRLSYQYLRNLVMASPEAWLIINKFKTRISKLKYAIVPEVDEEIAILNLVEQAGMLWISSGADDSWEPDFRGAMMGAIPEHVGGPLALGLKQALDTDSPMRRIKWLVNRAKMELTSELMPSCLVANDKLKVINYDSNMPMQTIIERNIDDACIYDSMGMALRPGMGGNLYDAYSVKGDCIVPLLYSGGERPKPPEIAYVSTDPNQRQRYVTSFREKGAEGMIALCHGVMNPLASGYGMSPVEAAVMAIAGLLYADTFNMGKFRSNIPSGLLAVGKMEKEKFARFKAKFKEEILGKAGGQSSLIPVPSDKNDVGLIPFNGLTAKDMEWSEWSKWKFYILCGCFQMSPLDVGMVMDYHRETTEAAKLTTSEGIEDMARFLEAFYTDGLVRKGMGLEKCAFRFERDESQDTPENAQRDKEQIMSGVKTVDDCRKRLGLSPHLRGGDTPVFLTKTGVTPLEQIDEEYEEATTPGAGGMFSEFVEPGAKPEDGKKTPLDELEDDEEFEKSLNKASMTVNQAKLRRNARLSRFRKKIRRLAEKAKKDTEKIVQDAV